MTTVLAIDPGNVCSGVVKFDGQRVLFAGIIENPDVLKIIADDRSDILAIELFVATNQRLGNESIETIHWGGRFHQASGDPDSVVLVPRAKVKKQLGLTQRDGDKEVNARLAALIGPKGTKAAPGPCFGVSSHSWAALGVAITALAWVNR
jgi:hypothetical protein